MKSSGLGAIDTELYDWYASIWEHVRQYRPRSMVEAPICRRDNVRRQQRFLNLGRKPWTSRGWVLKAEQLCGKATKIMDGSGALIGGNPRTSDVPVGRDGDDRTRPGNRLADGLPGCRPLVAMNGIHRVPVSKKQSGHRFSFH